MWLYFILTLCIEYPSMIVIKWLTKVAFLVFFQHSQVLCVGVSTDMIFLCNGIASDIKTSSDGQGPMYLSCMTSTFCWTFTLSYSPFFAAPVWVSGFMCHRPSSHWCEHHTWRRPPSICPAPLCSLRKCKIPLLMRLFPRRRLTARKPHKRISPLSFASSASLSLSRHLDALSLDVALLHLLPLLLGGRLNGHPRWRWEGEDFQMGLKILSL